MSHDRHIQKKITETSQPFNNTKESYENAIVLKCQLYRPTGEHKIVSRSVIIGEEYVCNEVTPLTSVESTKQLLQALKYSPNVSRKLKRITGITSFQKTKKDY